MQNARGTLVLRAPAWSMECLVIACIKRHLISLDVVPISKWYFCAKTDHGRLLIWSCVTSGDLMNTAHTRVAEVLKTESTHCGAILFSKAAGCRSYVIGISKTIVKELGYKAYILKIGTATVQSTQFLNTLRDTEFARECIDSFSCLCSFATSCWI